MSQVRDVGERVGLLLLAQRPRRPVGEARGLVELDVADRPHQVVVGNAVAEAADARRHLGVEDIGRDAAGELDEDLHILPGGVEDLGHALVGEQPEEGAEVDAGRQRVDEHSLVGGRGLYQTELRPVSRLTQEFGVDGDEIVLLGALAETREHRGGGDQLHVSVFSRVLRICS